MTSLNMPNIAELLNDSVSTGTQRSEDLIPAFMDVLEKYTLSLGPALRRQYDMVFAAMADEDYNGSFDEEWVADEATQLVESLICMLDDIAPENSYFGPHEGNCSDYGFWSYYEYMVY